MDLVSAGKWGIVAVWATDFSDPPSSRIRVFPQTCYSPPPSTEPTIRGDPQTLYEHLRTIERPLVHVTRRKWRAHAQRGEQGRARYRQHPLSAAYPSEFVQGLPEDATRTIGDIAEGLRWW